MIIEVAYIYRWMSIDKPVIILNFFTKIISTKIDSRWSDLSIRRLFLGWYEIFLLIYKRAPREDESVQDKYDL